MAKPELLSQLRDVHLPQDVSWWPLAIGWWVLIALLLLGISFFIIHRYNLKKKFHFSRLALNEISELEKAKESDWLIQLETLLKRAALCHFPKQQVAALTEQDWTKFLLDTGQNIWSDQSLAMLKDGAYRAPKTIDNNHKASLFEQSKQWLKQLPEEANNV